MTQKLSRDIPPIIMVTLNRFVYDRVAKTRKKRLDPVDLSYSIEINNEFLVEKEGKEGNDSQKMEVDGNEIVYDLYAIVIHSGVTAKSGHYYTIARDDVNKSKSEKWRSYNDTMVSEVDSDFILTISKKMKTETPYILFYKERIPGIRSHKIMADGIKNDFKILDKDGKLGIPPTLKKFVDTDNESYLKEKEYLTMKANKSQYSTSNFNFALLQELQKHLMRANDKGFDEARTMGPGGFGGYGKNNDFFGGGGGI
jgi:hypothetical protein